MVASRAEDQSVQAPFVFVGTVVRLKAATEPNIPVTEGTAVVQVDDVLRAPPALGDQADRQITVQLRAGEPAKEGEKAVFFTNPWLYGEGLAVVEVDRRRPQESARIREAIAPNPERESDDRLKARLEVAELVVAGVATNTRPLSPTPGPFVTEHDPEWWEAVIAVESVLKGAHPETVVRVLYAASMDVMWFQAPKIRVGQEGIWLLHRESIPKLNLRALAVLDPLDALRRDQLERVRRLLGGAPPAAPSGASRPRRRK